jgi:hypothetical protein
MLFPDAVQRVALAKRCSADPGSFHPLASRSWRCFELRVRNDPGSAAHHSARAPCCAAPGKSPAAVPGSLSRAEASILLSDAVQRQFIRSFTRYYGRCRLIFFLRCSLLSDANKSRSKKVVSKNFGKFRCLPLSSPVEQYVYRGLGGVRDDRNVQNVFSWLRK